MLHIQWFCKLNQASGNSILEVMEKNKKGLKYVKENQTTKNWK